MNKSELEQGKNTGLITPKPAPLDFIAGVETGVAFEVRNDSGNWKKFYPSNEYQFRRGRYDSMSCATFYGLNALETQIQFLLDTNQIPEDKKVLMAQLGYFDENGRVNFNESFSATLNGTTSRGNTFQAVGDGIRRDGVIPQKAHQQINDCKTIEEFLDPSRITDDMRALGKRFLEIFDVKYEWVVLGEKNAQSKILDHLRHAPLGFAVPTEGNWNEEGIIESETEGANHAVMNGRAELKKLFGILDNYEPFEKLLSWNYHIPYVFKLVVTVRTAPKPAPKPFSYRWERDLKEGMSGADVMMLQKALAHLGFFTLGYFTSYFGIYTKTALIKAQEAYKSEILVPAGVTNGRGTGNFAKFSRQWFNNRFA